jgi:hypothetical protein
LKTKVASVAKLDIASGDRANGQSAETHATDEINDIKPPRTFPRNPASLAELRVESPIVRFLDAACADDFEL